MKQLIITTLIVIVSGSFIACSRKFAAQPACNFVQNSDLQRVSWNESTPVKLFIHKSMPLERYPQMESVIREAVADWNRNAGREMIRIEAFGVSGDAVPKKDGYSLVYWLDTWEASAKNEQARTTIYWSGSQIYEADMRINGKDFSYYVGHDTSFVGVDFKSLFIHELGHVLGLAHNATSKSVMNVSLNVGQERREISKIDDESLHCEYN